MADEEKIRKLFEKYDDNKNGVGERKEFYIVFSDGGREMGESFPDKRNEQVAKEALENFDENHNGTIEFDEFCQVINFGISEKGYVLK